MIRSVRLQRQSCPAFLFRFAFLAINCINARVRERNRDVLEGNCFRRAYKPTVMEVTYSERRLADNRMGQGRHRCRLRSLVRQR